MNVIRGLFWAIVVELLCVLTLAAFLIIGTRHWAR